MYNFKFQAEAQMLKILFFILLSVSFSFSQSNELKIIYPEIGEEIDLSEENIQRLKMKFKEEGISEEDYEAYLEEELYFTILGCSWYCGGGPDTVISSSHLLQYKEITYEAKNAHDFDLRTAWVEGVEGYGIVEYLEYYFEHGPPLTTVLIYNGYLKTNKAWEENSRVKTIKLWINDEPYTILALEDTKAIQSFEIGTWQAPEGEELVLKFEICDIYKGTKYKDAAITELEFDGTGVHCFISGTLITMSDGNSKRIEDIIPGDKILSYNIITSVFEESSVKNVTSQMHHNLYKFDFGLTAIIATHDHPFLSVNKGWVSMMPTSSVSYLNIENTMVLEKGYNLLTLGESNNLNSAKLLDIKRFEGCYKTYAITRLSKNYVYFANGIAVGVEEIDNNTINRMNK